MPEEQFHRTGNAVIPPAAGPGSVIGISIGDLNGIGPEVILKTFSDPRMFEVCTPVLFASEKVVEWYRQNTLTEMLFEYGVTRDLASLSPHGLTVFNCWDEEVGIQPGALTETGGKYAVRSLQVAVQCLKDGQLDGLVTAPIHKGNTGSADFPFTGHTPFLKSAFGAKDVVMLLYQDDLRVALLTEHLPVKSVAAAVTREAMLSKLAVLRESLVRDFGIDKPRIAVLGLNPHAGDEGRIGDEEAKVILPVVEELRKAGHLVFGPYPADGFFARRQWETFDAVLAMYHDQGLVPFKMLAGGGGVNYTAGLPIVRTSPDHGTAFDIARQGIADETAFRTAVFECIDLVRRRKEYAEATASPLQRSKGQKEGERR